jgi:hypothetical protein
MAFYVVGEADFEKAPRIDVTDPAVAVRQYVRNQGIQSGRIICIPASTVEIYRIEATTTVTATKEA